jgi:hypothetical protein
VAARRVVILDPAGRHGNDLARAAAAAGLAPEVLTGAPDVSAIGEGAVVLASIGAAGALAADGAGTRWVFGDQADAGKLAGAAVACGATGVLVLPVPPAALAALAGDDATTAEA